MCNLVVAGWLAAVLVPAAGAEESSAPAGLDFRVVRRGDHDCVEVTSEGKAALRSPPEGLWSIAADWRDGWPADWRHAHAARVEKAGR